VVHSLCVQLGRLLPQLVCELVPAPTSVTTFRIERREERGEIEYGQGRHVRQGTTIRPEDLIFE
jgi:hypothetical protein